MNVVIMNAQSKQHLQIVLVALADLKDTNQIACLFSSYLSQAVERVCKASVSATRVKSNGAPWFDKYCRVKRPLAIQAGLRVECEKDMEIQIAACKNYCAHKQRKRRKYYNDCVELIIVDKYESDRSNLWKTIEKLSKTHTRWLR